jgi:hypothetical protein
MALNIMFQRVGTDTSIDQVERLVHNLPSHLPIISIGSGNGCFERMISDKIRRNIICVDPHPTSHYSTKTLYMGPDYATVHELIAAYPEYVGNCIVMIIFSYPTGWYRMNRMPEPTTPYDIEAIKLLNPMGLYITGELSGGACDERVLNTVLNMSRYVLKSEFKPSPSALIDELLAMSLHEIQIYDGVGMVYFGAVFTTTGAITTSIAAPIATPTATLTATSTAASTAASAASTTPIVNIRKIEEIASCPIS